MANACMAVMQRLQPPSAKVTQNRLSMGKTASPWEQKKLKICSQHYEHLNLPQRLKGTVSRDYFLEGSGSDSMI